MIRKLSIENYQYLEKNLACFSEEYDFPLYVRKLKNLPERCFKEDKQYWKDFYLRFSEYLYTERKAYDMYVGSMFKLMRAFFNYLNNEKEMGIGDYHERFYIIREVIPVLTISPERLNFLIYNKGFEKKLTPAQRKYKDMMVLGCTVALRYGDLLRLGKEHIDRTGESVYMVMRSQKTQIDTRVKLPPYAIAIIDRYDDGRKKFFKRVATFNFNKAMKRITFRAGWIEELPKTRNRRGIPQLIYKDPVRKQHYRFCDLVSSHTMRRTAITTMLRLGMEEIYVRRISGHAPHTGSFFRYVQFAGSFVDEQLDKVHAKLKVMRSPRDKKAWDAGDLR